MFVYKLIKYAVYMVAYTTENGSYYASTDGVASSPGFPASLAPKKAGKPGDKATDGEHHNAPEYRLE